MVPACCQPFEKVMSLDASCLDTGMPGLCGFQTEGKVGHSSTKSRDFGSLLRAKRAMHEEVKFAVLRLPS